MILFFSKTVKPKNNHVVNMLRSYTVFFSAEYYAFLVCFAGEAFEFYYITLVFLMLEFPLKYVHRISQKTCLKLNIDRLIK